MTLIKKSRNYTREQIIEQETIKAFYDKLYETFNSRPYLYDICKDLIENGPSDYRNFDIYTLAEYEDDIYGCHKRIKISSTIYDNAYIKFNYKYQIEINSQNYFLNVSVALRFDRGKPVFSAISFNKDNLSLLKIKDYYRLFNYEFSNQVLNEKDDAEVYGFISDDESDEIIDRDVNISPSDFAYGICKAIIS